jgi:hypothetical protein
MAPTHQFLTADVQFQSHGNLCEICGKQNGSKAGFSLSSAVFEHLYHFTMCHTHSRSTIMNAICSRHWQHDVKMETIASML